MAGVLTQAFKSSWLASFVWAGTGLLSLVLGLLFVFQDKLLYHPCIPGVPRSTRDNPPGYRSPDEHKVQDWEELYIKTRDGVVVHAWLLLQPQTSRTTGTIIYFHGNAGNMGFRLAHGSNLYRATKCNVLMVDYRGYGMSTGTPSEEGLLLDAEAVLEEMKRHKKVDGSKLILYGKSLGGAVALALAEAHPNDILGLVLENTFLSIGAMVDVILPYVKHFKSLILRIGWRNDLRIQNVAQPILLISGLLDELVPPAHVRELQRLAKRSRHCELYTVADGTHNDTFFRGGIAYYKRYASFVQRLLEEAANSGNGSVGSSSGSARVGQVAEDACRSDDELRQEGGGLPLKPQAPFVS